jgi:DUF2975 family protein
MKNTKAIVTHRGSTLILRGTVIFIGLVVLGLCVFALPAGIMSDKTGLYRWILLGLYIPAVPFFFALYQAMKLLSYIDKNRAFSKLSVNALMYIKYCAIIITALFTAGMPYIYYVADRDDAPGVVAIGLVIIGASFVIATFSGVMQKLVETAVAIKSENDLTV